MHHCNSGRAPRQRNGDNKYRFAIRSFETTDCIVQTIRAGVSSERGRDRHSEAETKLGPAARAVRQVDSSRIFLRMHLRLLYLYTANHRIPHRDSLLHSAFSTLRLLPTCHRASEFARKGDRETGTFPKIAYFRQSVRESAQKQLIAP